MWSMKIVVLLFFLFMPIKVDTQGAPLENLKLKSFSWVMEQLANNLELSDDLQGPFTMPFDKFARPYSDTDGCKVVRAEGVTVEPGVSARVARVYVAGGNVMYRNVVFYASGQHASSGEESCSEEGSPECW